MIKVAVIENENQVYVDLNQIFVENYQDIQIIGYAKTKQEGIELITSTKPDLVFFNINLMFDNIPDFKWQKEFADYKIVFLADDNNQAIMAIKWSCFDYIVKPINSTEIINSIEKYRSQSGVNNITQNKKVHLHRNIFESSKPQKIIIPTSDQFYLVNPIDIVRLEAGKIHTIVYFSSGKVVLAMKNLKNYEQQLINYGFVRLHNSHLVNMVYIKSFVKGIEPKIMLIDGTIIPVSRRRKSVLFDSLGSI